MPKSLEVQLNPSQRAELEQLRDHAPKAYLRERAAAILKIAAGQSGHEVAEHRLLKRRKRQTVSEWVHRYQQEGLAGLSIRSGRGRRPAFSPTSVDGS